jgi:hypothetical protein
MTYPRRQHAFATHKECAHFSNGFCTANGVMVSPNQPACPNFKPKGTTIAPRTEKPYQQPRQLFQVPLLLRQPFPVPPSDPENIYTTTQRLMPQHGYSSFQQRGVYSMSSGRAGGRGGGGGGGRGGRGRGRMGGFAAGAGGSCVCPNCGYTEPHRLGTPCFQQKCPKCGTPMTRTR